MPFFQIAHIGYGFHEVFLVFAGRKPTEQECRARLTLMETPPDGDDISINAASWPPVWDLPTLP